jgi:hypothetical protein
VGVVGCHEVFRWGWPDRGGAGPAGAVRFQAAEMFEAGMKAPQVAWVLRVSGESAYAWHAAWREGGMDALCSKGP